MLKVVIVEDEEIIRRGLICAFDWLSMGCVVVGEAADGVEGLELLGSVECDVVITDIKMPRMGGIEMLETARALAITGFTSVLLTSYAEFEYARRAIKLRVFDYLLKPVDEDKLRDVMKRIAESRRQEEPRQQEAQAGNAERQEIGEGRSGYVSYAVKRITEDYGEKLSIETVAAECGVSASYLSRRFREETSQTFLDTLNRYRVQRACELLRQGGLKMYEVSEKTGFNDYKHFSGVFRKYMGVTPTDYIKGSAAE